MPNSGFLDGHRKRKQKRQEEERASVASLERAAFEAEEAAKDETSEFLDDFLQNSIWNEQLEQISIERDVLPPLHELCTYGDLGETEGTQACRRLFKAVVIWDDLGHSLWKKLKTEDLSSRIPRINIPDQESSSSGSSTPSTSRRSSGASVESQSSLRTVNLSPRRSSVAAYTSSIYKGISSKMPMRRATDPNTYSIGSNDSSLKLNQSRMRFPRMSSAGTACNTIPRRAMGSLSVGDGMLHAHHHNTCN